MRPLPTLLARAAPAFNGQRPLAQDTDGSQDYAIAAPKNLAGSTHTTANRDKHERRRWPPDDSGGHRPRGILRSGEAVRRTALPQSPYQRESARLAAE